MNRILARVAAIWALCGGVLLLAITLVTSWNAGAFLLARLGLPVQGLPGYEDFVRLTVSAAALMFFPWCQLRRGHVAVELFVSALPPWLRSGLDRLWLALMGLLALFLGYWMVLGGLETYLDGASSSILAWPEWPFYVPGIVSLVLWAMIALRQAAYGARMEEPDGA